MAFAITYVDGKADVAKACDIVLNAKMRRTGICGATETVLIDRAFPHPESIINVLASHGCEVRGSADIAALDDRVKAASAEDWDTEYLDAICSVALVDGVAGAMAHNRPRTALPITDCIITEDQAAAEVFLSGV